MVKWTVCVVLFLVCAVVEGATLKEYDPARLVPFGGIYRRSVTTTESISNFDWNNIADNLVELAKADMRQTGKAQFPIPDVEEEKSISLGFINVKYKLRAGEGTVSNFTSFRRTGDVLLTKDSKETLQGAIPITLDRLRVSYGSYEVKVLGLTISGVLRVTMENMKFVMTIFGSEVGDGCTASVVDVKVEDPGKMDVDVTGLGALNGLTSGIVRYFAERRSIGFVSTVESVLLQELKKVLDEYQCDELHSLFLLVGN